MDTQTQIDRLIELAIVQRSELKALVEQLPQLREYLGTEIEKTFEQVEPQLRTELEEFCNKKTEESVEALRGDVSEQVSEILKTLEISAAAKYSALMAERERNIELEKQAQAKIAEAAAALPSQVKEIVTAELARFPRAGEIDQLRKEFAEPRGLNPRGKWVAGETYNKLDLVTFNGDSFVSNIDGNTEKPSRSAANWTLNAARGISGGGGGITSLNDILGNPSTGDIVGSEGNNYVRKTLTAGDGIGITETPTTITIDASAAQQKLTATVKNAESFAITRGQVVYLFGATGNMASVKLASNTSDATSAKTFGVVSDASIAANGTGIITCVGVQDQLTLGAYNEGDTLYLGATAGSVTNVKPYAPNHLVYVGIVERANNGNGELYVKIQNGYELDEIHDVQINNPRQSGQTLIYDATNALWKNARLTAGVGVSISNGDSSITISADGGVNYQGTWNASTNTPTLTSSVGTKGFYYVVSVAGSTNLNGVTDWQVGDWAIFNGTAWQKVDTTDQVSSVFGRTGAVVGVSTDYSSVGITNTAIGASNPSTGAFTTLSATGNLTVSGTIQGAASSSLTIAPGSGGSQSIVLGGATTGGIYLKNTITNPLLCFNYDGGASYTHAFSINSGSGLDLKPVSNDWSAGWVSSVTSSSNVMSLAASTTTLNGQADVGGLLLSLNSTVTPANGEGIAIGFRLGSGITSKIVGVRSGATGVGHLAIWTRASGDGTTAGTEKVRITDIGNFLVGGTTDISGSGGIKVFGSTASTSTTSGALQVVGGVGVGGAINAGGNLTVSGTSSLFGASSYLDSDASTPVLAVTGARSTTAAGVFTNQLNIQDTGTLAAGQGGAINFGGNASGGVYRSWGAISGAKTNATATDYAGGLKFWTRVGGGSMREALHLDTALTATFAGNLTVSGGTITGGASGMSLAAGGTNQNITLTPSGTGSVNVNLPGSGLLNVNSSASSPGRVAWFNTSSTISNGAEISVGVGDGLASARSAFLGIRRTAGGTYYGFLETYASGGYLALQTGSGKVVIGKTSDSANGALQLADHTTSAGGIGFGTDISLYRSSANAIRLSPPSGGSTIAFELYNGSGNTFKLVYNYAYSPELYSDDALSIRSNGGAITLKSANTTALTLTSAQQVQANATTDSTSTTTGALTVAGGVGIAKAAYIGGGLNVVNAGNLTSGIQISGTSDNIALDFSNTGTGGLGAAVAVTSGTSGFGQGKLVLVKRSDNTSIATFDIASKSATFAGAVAIGNTVNTVSPTSPNRTITMVIGGTTYYIHAKTTND